MFGSETQYLAALLVGLFGSVHCLGMCGGIAATLAVGSAPASGRRQAILFAYNLGRLASYAAAGALAGALGEALAAGTGLRAARWLLQGLAAGFMLLLGFYLAGWWPLLARLEQLGGHLWRRIEPLGRRWLPVRDPLSALPLGLLWGWLPCGLVYSVLAWSTSSGGAAAGAGLMLAFGAGTLPSMLAAGVLAQRWRQLAAGRLRVAAGVLVLALGVAGLASVAMQVAGAGHGGMAAGG